MKIVRKTKVKLFIGLRIWVVATRNYKLKMAGITQNGQRHLIFIVVHQLWIADRSQFVKKKDSKTILRTVIITMAM